MGKGEIRCMYEISDEELQRATEEEKRICFSVAIELNARMKRMIDAVVSKCIGFNNVMDWDDYRADAVLACYDAVLRYVRYHGTKPDGTSLKSDMKLETFAHWFIGKRLFNSAKCEDIVYSVYDKDNIFVKSMRNSEYRKTKKQLESEGCTVRSARSTFLFSELAVEKDGKAIEYIPADDPEAAIW